jgi:hypothetical protein
MTDAQKIAALRRIYALYEEYTRTLLLACRKHCAHCCTGNLTLTSLEAEHIRQSLSPEKLAELRGALDSQPPRRRYRPQITLNQMAGLCARGGDLPEEEIDPDWGSCPLLAENACPIYECRPFGCRCLLSTRNCGETGFAEIDEYTITVTHVFLQFIEHLDQSGCFGNLSDMLASGGKDPHFCGSYPQAGESRLIRNHPIPVLLIPPEHQSRIRPLVETLDSVLRNP